MKRKLLHALTPALLPATLQAAVLLQVDSALDPALAAPPAGYTWWQGLLHLAMLTASGIIAHAAKLLIERRSAGGVRRAVREMDRMRREGLLTDEEFAEQKRLLLRKEAES